MTIHDKEKIVNIRPFQKTIERLLAGAMMTSSTAFALGVGSCTVDQVANGAGSVGAQAAMIMAMGGDADPTNPTLIDGIFSGDPDAGPPLRPIGGVFSGDPDAGNPVRPIDLFSGDGDASDPSRFPRIPRL